MVPQEGTENKENNRDFDHPERFDSGRTCTIHQVYSGAVQMRRRLARVSTEVHMKRLFLSLTFVVSVMASAVVHADSLSFWVNSNGDNFRYTGTMNDHDFLLVG